MKIDLDFSGLEALMENISHLASKAQIRKTNRKVLQRSIPHVLEAMERNIPESDGKVLSGRKGYRPKGHARRYVPISKITTRGTNARAEVGWPRLGNGSEFFYLKFVEWGTIRQPPRGFVRASVKETERTIAGIAEREYLWLLQESLIPQKRTWDAPTEDVFS